MNRTLCAAALLVSVLFVQPGALAQTALTITTADQLPALIVGVPFSQTFAATGGSPPYTWNVETGSLPAGLTLTPAGVLSGTYNGSAGVGIMFALAVKDSVGTKATKTFFGTKVVNQLTVVTQSELPRGKAGDNYFVVLGASGGAIPVTWSFDSGSLPPFLMLWDVGWLTSPPGGYSPPPELQSYGTFRFTATARDAVGQRASREFVLNVDPVRLQFTTDSLLPEAPVGSSYRQRIAVTGASARGGYRLEIVGGSMSPDLTLTGPGMFQQDPLYNLAGTPKIPGRYSYVIKAIEPYGTEITKTFSLVVPPDPTPRVLAQLAFGGGWYSALYFTNNGTASASFRVDFVSDLGIPLIVPGLAASSLNIDLNPRGTAVIEARDIGPLNQGYVSASLPKDVVGYGIFRQSVSGIPDQEAAVPLSGVYAASSNLIYDDTSFLTAVSIVNPSPVPTTVGITVRDEQGKVLATSSLPLDARCKKAAFLRELPGMGSIAGHRGSVDFVVTTGNIAVLGLRFGGAAFTTIQTTEK